MLGQNDPRLSVSDSSYLSPFQQLRSTASEVPTTNSFPQVKSSFSEFPQSQEPVFFRESVPPTPVSSAFEKNTLLQEYILSIANQVNTLRKINRHLASGNEMMDTFVTTNGGTAIELRGLLASLFTEIELLSTANLQDLLKAQKKLASTATSNTSSSTPLLSPHSFNRLVLPSSMSTLPYDAPFTAPISQHTNLEKHDQSFNFIAEKIKESSLESSSNSSNFSRSTLGSNFPQTLNMNLPDSYTENSEFFGMPSFGKNSMDFMSQTQIQPQAPFASNSTNEKTSSQNKPLDFQQSAFQEFDSNIELFQNLGFSSGPTSHNELSLAPEKKRFKKPSTQLAPDFLNLQSQLASPFAKNENGMGISSDFSSLQISGKEKKRESSLPQNKQDDSHVDMIFVDLKTSIDADFEIKNAQPTVFVKELVSAMDYHATAITRLKFDSPVKFDLPSLHQDLKSYAKLHKSAYEYELNLLALFICSKIQQQETVDRNILCVCTTIMAIEKLFLRVFSFLYVLIPHLRNEFFTDQLISEIPQNLREVLENQKCCFSLSILFAALSVQRIEGNMMAFYLTPVLEASRVILHTRPQKNSEEFKFVMTILELSSFYLSSYSSKKFGEIQTILQQEFEVDEEEFGFLDPEKVWPFFIKKDTWDVESVLGFFVQYTSDASIRKLHQDSLVLSLDPNVSMDKNMGFKLRPLFSQIIPELKWVKKATRVTKQVFAVVQKEKERAFLANILSVWIMRPQSQVLNIGSLSLDQLQHLCQVLVHVFASFRIFKLSLFHSLLLSCRLLVPGQLVPIDITPEEVVAYGRFWATLATTIPWFGEPNNYFVSPIFMLLENLPSHVHSELLVLTILEVSDSVLAKYKPSKHEEILKKLCAKFPKINEKYKKVPAKIIEAPTEEPVSISAQVFQSNLRNFSEKIQKLLPDEISSLSKSISDQLTSSEKTLECDELLDTTITSILDRAESLKDSEFNAITTLSNLTYELIEKHNIFYTNFMAKLVERCPLLSTQRLPFAVNDPEKLAKFLSLIQLFIVIQNFALLRGSTVMNGTTVLFWYEHVIRSPMTDETADILCAAIRVSHNFLSIERFKTFLSFIRGKAVNSLPDTPGKQKLLQIFEVIFKGT